MWCFISEPNGIIHEIFLPKNAVGQDCLEKVRNYNSATQTPMNIPKAPVHALNFSLSF